VLNTICSKNFCQAARFTNLVTHFETADQQMAPHHGRTRPSEIGNKVCSFHSSVIKTSGIKQEKASNRASRKRPSSTKASKHPSNQVPMEAATKHPSTNATSSVEARAQVLKQEHELLSEERSASASSKRAASKRAKVRVPTLASKQQKTFSTASRQHFNC
jgi:hypothetical protein